MSETTSETDNALVLRVLHAYLADADSWAEADAALRATARRAPRGAGAMRQALDNVVTASSPRFTGLSDLVVREGGWVLEDTSDVNAARFLSAVADLLRRVLAGEAPPAPTVRQPDPSATRTLEGALHGDPPWARPHVRASRWFSTETMDRVVDDHFTAAWDEIREVIANGRYVATFDAGEEVGEGFVDASLGREARPRPVLTRTSTVRLVLDLDVERNQVFIVTAHPLLPLA